MIRKIRKEDRPLYLAMAQRFYASDAVYRNVPACHFSDTFDELMRSEEYAACYMMEYEGCVAGYALLAKAFSQEAGGMVIWIEELYVMPEYRGRGLGHEFFAYLKDHLCGGVKRIRLEVEDDNTKAISLYRRMGLKDLPYSQMIRDL